VISAIGDALSLIRAERERTFHAPTAADTRRLIAEVEAEAVQAGAGAASLDVRVEHNRERGTVRVTVTGAVTLSSGAVPGRRPATAQDAAGAAEERGYPDVSPAGQHWLAVRPGRGPRVAVFDRFADLIVDVEGEAVRAEEGADLGAVIARHTRRVGPVTMVPDAWVVGGARLLQVPEPTPESIAETAALLATDGVAVTIIVGRE
jgi:hypothetical protein